MFTLLQTGQGLQNLYTYISLAAFSWTEEQMWFNEKHDQDKICRNIFSYYSEMAQILSQ